MALAPLQETLLVLTALKDQLEPALTATKRHRHDDEVKFTICNHILILVSSFLEEWQRFERLGQDASVRKTIDSARPAAARIREWQGISRLRSSALVHGFRQRDGALTKLEPLFKPGRAPTTYAEQLLLGELAVYTIATAMCQHHELHQQAMLEVYKDGPDNIATIGIQSLAEFDAEISRIRNLITDSDPRLETCFGPLRSPT